MLSVLTFISIGILVLTFCKIKWGAAYLLAAMLLMPEIVISISGFIIKKNYVILIFFLIFFFKYKIRKHLLLDMKPFRFVSVYLFLCLLMIPLQVESNYMTQLRYFLADFVMILLLPVSFWNILNEYNCSLLFRRIIIVCVIIAAVYGIVLAATGILNPYTLLFASEFRDNENLELMMNYYEPGGGRLFGRISSVCYHPMTYAFFLGLSFFYVLQIRNKISNFLYGLLLLLLSVNIIICGVRTLIASMLITVIFYLLMLKNFKLMIGAILFAFFSYSIISITPLSGYIDSIVSPQDSSDEVSGSSIELRMEQFGGAIDEVKNSFLVGKGYAWDREYQEKNGDHPVLLAFESLIFIIICDNGILGFFIWGLLIYIYRSYILSKIKERKKQALFMSFICFYISFSCITGEYGYMRTFVLFYTFILYESSMHPYLLVYGNSGEPLKKS
ncbi:MAG: hypothetical protein IJ635_02545 [Bacteroidaceae bacterium]|nr:hypothetical protein [Bacteroidaceae bacterium]